MLPAVGRLSGIKRKLVIIACYLPPNYAVPKGRAALEHVSYCIIQAKRKYNEPLIVVTGDFNQWPLEEAMADYVEFNEVRCGPTRQGRSINRMFTNFPYSVTGTVPPLESDDSSKKSNHKVAFMSASLERAAPVVWLTYQYRYYNADSAKKFGDWLVAAPPISLYRCGTK